MQQLIDAAARNAIVTCTIISVAEHISAKGNNTLKILMQCKDADNMKLDGVLAKYLSHNGMIYARNFLDSLTKPVNVVYESGSWIYNEEEFVGNTVRCQLKTKEYNEKLYPDVEIWMPIPDSETFDDPLPDFTDEDLPF